MQPTPRAVSDQGPNARSVRLNLPKFDAKMQAQLEGYLVSVGILQKGQTLSAQELPPEADAISSSSAFED